MVQQFESIVRSSRSNGLASIVSNPCWPIPGKSCFSFEKPCSY